MKIPGMKKFVAQVKPANNGKLKWQFELRVALEMLEEDGMLEKAIHARATRIAQSQQRLGHWPEEGSIVVWYAEIDEDKDIPINQVDWHVLMENK